MSKATQKKRYIIPFAERRKFDIVVAMIGVVLLGTATAFVWYAVANGAGDLVAILTAGLLTAAFGCALTALVTGRMAWLLLGSWMPF